MHYYIIKGLGLKMGLGTYNAYKWVMSSINVLSPHKCKEPTGRNSWMCWQIYGIKGNDKCTGIYLSPNTICIK